jgi:hypothetical protein
VNKSSSSKISETHWERIDAMKDEDIDLSDIPEATEVEYFKVKAGDRGYQTLINEALAEHIRSHNLKDDLRHILREELERAKNAS